MRALIQRVNCASVHVNQEILAEIGRGLLVFLGVGTGDTIRDAEWLAGKIGRMRIFSDEQDKMNRSVQDIEGSVLVVSQFTLYGDAHRGNRPGFDAAAAPGAAEPLYEHFCTVLRSQGIPVQTGRFAAMMVVRLENDGPVTLWLETPDRLQRQTP
jgi:D-aminoacyl-tRNA deacylase